MPMKPTLCGAHESDVSMYSYRTQLKGRYRCTCGPLGAFWYCSCVGSRRCKGPVTEHVATEFQAQRGCLQVSYADLAECTGLSEPTVVGCLKGVRTIALEAYLLLCAALELEAGKLLDEAQDKVAGLAVAPGSPRLSRVQELRQQRLQADAMPVEEAADARPRADGDDDDWEPR